MMREEGGCKQPCACECCRCCRCLQASTDYVCQGQDAEYKRERLARVFLAIACIVCFGILAIVLLLEPGSKSEHDVAAIKAEDVSYINTPACHGHNIVNGLATRANWAIKTMAAFAGLQDAEDRLAKVFLAIACLVCFGTLAIVLLLDPGSKLEHDGVAIRAEDVSYINTPACHGHNIVNGLATRANWASKTMAAFGRSAQFILTLAGFATGMFYAAGHATVGLSVGSALGVLAAVSQIYHQATADVKREVGSPLLTVDGCLSANNQSDS